MLLQVEDLTIAYRRRDTLLRAAEDVTFHLEKGQCLGLIGESGCGKSSTIRGMLRLLERNGEVVSGRTFFKGVDLLTISQRELREILWKEISMVPQASMNSFNPVCRVEHQILEAVKVHKKLNRFTKRQFLSKAAWLFDEVGLDPRRMRSYPHQLSGGMAQRAVLAMALVLDPTLLIMDEPTSALDVVTQEKVLGLFRRLLKKGPYSMILISHDLSVMLRVCDRLAVMYAGQLVEIGAREEVLASPLHPYTMGLMASLPRMNVSRNDVLFSIPGTPPDLSVPSAGCRFGNRCPFRIALCSEPLRMVGVPESPGHRASCHRSDFVHLMREAAKHPRTWKNSNS